MIKDIDVLEAFLRTFGWKRLKRLSPSRLVVLIPDASETKRRSTLRDIASQLRDQGERFSYYSSYESSTVGAVLGYGKYVIFCNPIESKNPKLFKGGYENEDYLVRLINRHVKMYGKPLDVHFIAQSGKRFLVPRVNQAKNNKEGGHTHHKADITLFDLEKTPYPISLKKDNAEFWENAQNYYGENAMHIMHALLHSGDIKLLERGGGTYDIAPKFAIKLTDQQAKRVMFGQDVSKRNGAIIIRSFKNEDFVYDGENQKLVVHTSFIYKTLSDQATNKRPYFVIRYDRKSGGRNLMKGMRLEAVTPSRVSREMIKIEPHEVSSLIRKGKKFGAPK